MAGHYNVDVEGELASIIPGMIEDAEA